MLIDRAQQALAGTVSATTADLGRAFLEILSKPPSNLLGWRTAQRLAQLRKQHPGAIERASGALIRSDQPPPAAIDTFVQEIWPLFAAGEEKSLPYADIRAVPTMVLALAKPDEAIAVRYTPMHVASKRLLHCSLFANGPLNATEYQQVLMLAEDLRTIMRDEWHWQPRDLWDVQGFIWATCSSPAPEETAEKPAEKPAVSTTAEATGTPKPTNLILYGPPGTGKTYATARRAVELCDGRAPADPVAVKQRYDELCARKRIEFVTFHQSYGYEEFVEGLRPETGPEEEEGGVVTGGFRLAPKPGVFRRIADRAHANRGTKVGSGVAVEGRQAFKMSLGNTALPDEAYLFDECVANGYLLLGYGGEVDWSGHAYQSVDAIKQRWRQVDPGAKDTDPNIRQVHALRSALQQGDLVIISNGNTRFRAVGEVTGPYSYVKRDQDHYHHQRPIRWLWVDRDGLPCEDIYAKQFSQVSIYRLNAAFLNWAALQQVVDGAEQSSGAAPEPYVLIIDEINRANVSKVFGELITLLEPDKRLGQPNALTVTLPYSGASFGVPANLHIIGTMNTADRSIALLDTALRRRFAFEELMPDPSILAPIEEIDVGTMLTALNARIEYLFDRDHQIGHAYFTGCQSRADLEEVMRRKVIPLLSEFFYEDWEKVRAVLNETTDEGSFIRRTRLSAPGLLAGGEAEGTERWRYAVRDPFAEDAFDRLIG